MTVKMQIGSSLTFSLNSWYVCSLIDPVIIGSCEIIYVNFIVRFCQLFML